MTFLDRDRIEFRGRHTYFDSQLGMVSPDCLGLRELSLRAEAMEPSRESVGTRQRRQP